MGFSFRAEWRVILTVGGVVHDDETSNDSEPVFKYHFGCESRACHPFLLVCIAESWGCGCFDRINRAPVRSLSPPKANEKTSSQVRVVSWQDVGSTSLDEKPVSKAKELRHIDESVP